MNEPRFLARLRCGHDAPLQGEPRVGGWITCLDLRCQQQRPVVSVSSLLRAPRAGETGIQETLWEELAS